MRNLYTFGLIVLVAVLTGQVFAEEFTMSTYYPAPYGVYNEMRANKLVIGDPDSSTTPASSFNGGMTFKGLDSDPGLAESFAEGTIYYNQFDDVFKYSPDGSSWTEMGGGYWTKSNSDIYYDEGRVGIGTTNPGAELDVSGHIWQTGTGQSVFLGEGAGKNDNLSDNRNVFVGYEAGYANTTGVFNTALGWRALRRNTANPNTAVGSTALAYNTTGYNNTAVGSGTLYNNTTGYYNTALGDAADVALGNLTNTIAIGYNARVNTSNKAVIGNSSLTTIGGYANWSNYSDRRLKENIVYKDDLGLSFITRLKTTSFNYKDDENKRSRDGLIGQDVQKVLEELGLEFSGLSIDDDEEKTLNLSYERIVIPLINAVQEQQRQLEELKMGNKTIKQRIEVLEQKLGI